MVCNTSRPTTIWSTAASASSISLTDGEREFRTWAAAISNRGRWSQAPIPTTTVAHSRFCSSRTLRMNELARLLILLVQNDRLRQALLASGMEVTRDELDRRIPQDAFLSDTVAPVFNDPNESVSFSFPQEIGEVDASYEPS